MNVVGKVSSFITKGMYSVATPFHPFGGAVDIIVVKQEDGTFRSTPWYVRFGKFQGVLKGAEKLVRIEVNGVEANFHMHLDNSGEAYFVREVDPDKHDDSENLESSREDNYIDDLKENDFQEHDINGFNKSEIDVRDERLTLGMNGLERVESDCDRIFYEFQDENSLEGSVEFSEYGSSRYDNLDNVERALDSQDSGSEVVLVSVDGHMLTAPISSAERNVENVELDTPQFHLGPGEGTEEYNTSEDTWSADYLGDLDKSACKVTNDSEVMANSLKRNEVFKSCVELGELALKSRNGDQENTGPSVEIIEANTHEKSPQSPLTNDKIDEGSPELSRNDEGSPRFTLAVSEIHESTFDMDSNVVDNGALSHPDSGISTSVILPEVKDETEIHGSSSDTDDDGNDRTVQFDSNDLELQKQIEVDITEKVMESSEEVHASEDESSKSEHVEHRASNEDMKPELLTRVEISLCGNLLHDGMGSSAAEDAFEANRVSPEEFKLSAATIIKNENLIVRLQGKYLPWDKAAYAILGMAAFGLDLPIDLNDIIHVENETPETNKDDSEMTSTPSRRWRLWPIPFRRVKTLEHSDSNSPSEEIFVDSESVSSQPVVIATESPRKQIIRTNVPTTDQIESLNLKDGQNMVNFVFSTRVLGSQKVEAHIYLWKWNTRIVISDVDGTITKSDVLGQFMPLVGKDWTHSGIARLFSAIKENGYQLLFLSARAIVQAYLTKSFLFNLKQDGKSLPNGPVVISPDGLFPSLYREVIRRAPHEFKIACLEDIKALFPSDYNPFYAGFGNRDTDELSYRKIGIPKGKIFIINPKGEVAINHRNDVKSYTSLHTLVHDMFPPTALIEQEDYNSWNYWKMPLLDIDNL